MKPAPLTSMIPLVVLLGGWHPLAADQDEPGGALEHGQEQQREPDTIPVAFPVTRYSSIWENSPFNREVVNATPPPVLSDFAKNLVLEGLINDRSQGPIAYVRDVGEGKSIVITREATEAHAYRIAESTMDRDPAQTVVVVTDGEREAEIRYAGDSFTRTIAAPPPAEVAAEEKTISVSSPGIPSPAGEAAGEDQTSPPGAADSAPPGAAPAAGTLPEPSEAPSASAPSSPDNPDADPRRRRILLPGSARPQNPQ